MYHLNFETASGTCLSGILSVENSRPGRIQAATRHPMLAATKLRAFAHLLVNGSLADVLLFRAFLVTPQSQGAESQHTDLD